jgi:hypothetical protein
MNQTNPQQPPLVYQSTTLPDNLRAELVAMLAAMEKRYGPAAVRMGTHIENLAQVCSMIQHGGDLDADTRDKAYQYARSACGEVILELGRMSGAKPEDAFAVAVALQDYTRHAGDELLGESAMPAPVAEEAAQVMARAAAK